MKEAAETAAVPVKIKKEVSYIFRTPWLYYFTSIWKFFPKNHWTNTRLVCSHLNMCFSHWFQIESCGPRFLAPQPHNAPLSFASTWKRLKNSTLNGPDPGPTRLHITWPGTDQNNSSSPELNQFQTTRDVNTP